MKVLVTGVKGQLGHDVVNELEKRGHTAVGVDIEEMDITDFTSVKKTLTAVSPEAVIHCAAWTAVDAAEDTENQEKVHLVNAVGTDNIAKMCRHLDIACMYISTDYVFNGQGTDSWKPDCKDYAPLNVYGQSNNGKSTAGHQRYLCSHCRKTWQLQFTYTASQPGTHQKIIDMAMNGVGCRATARIMGVGLNTVLRHLKNSGRSR